jgi:putative DNA primase/helicase
MDRVTDHCEREAWEAQASNNGQAQRRARANVVTLADVEPEPVDWLWPGRVALGKLTLLCGDPGLGKSFATLDIASRVSTGSPWPDNLTRAPQGGVILLSAEDDIADTIVPRLVAMDADRSRIVAIKGIAQANQHEAHLDLTTDLAALEGAISELPNCKLVVIDPVTAYLGETDSHKNAEVRAILSQLSELAGRHKVAILAVTHLNKASTMPAIYRAMGSLAFMAAARCVWIVARDESDETGRRRLFVSAKNSLASDTSGLAYALVPERDTARVAWERDAVSLRADQVMGGGRKAEALEEAITFVRETVEANGGDMLSDDLSTAAEAEGITEATLRRAKKKVCRSYREKGAGGRWRACLKEAGDNQGAQDVLDTSNEQH